MRWMFPCRCSGHPSPLRAFVSATRKPTIDPLVNHEREQESESDRKPRRIFYATTCFTTSPYTSVNR